MFTKKDRRFNTLLKNRSNKRKLSVYLDEEAFERLERLRRKLGILDDSQIMGLCLKVMEKRTDKIITIHPLTKKA